MKSDSFNFEFFNVNKPIPVSHQKEKKKVSLLNYIRKTFDKLSHVSTLLKAGVCYNPIGECLNQYFETFLLAFIHEPIKFGANPNYNNNNNDVV